MKISLLLTLIIACCLFTFFVFSSGDQKHTQKQGTAIDTSPQQDQAIRYRWEPLYFREIKNRIEGTEVKNLRDQEISPNSREVRIWIGFSHDVLEGLIFTQTEDIWAGRYLPSIGRTSNIPKSSQPLPVPKNGWNPLWDNLEKLGIYSLADALDIGVDNVYPDATSVVVEIKTHKSYRAYKYSGFTTSERSEPKKMLEIVNILSNEFGLELLNE